MCECSLSPGPEISLLARAAAGSPVLHHLSCSGISSAAVRQPAHPALVLRCHGAAGAVAVAWALIVASARLMLGTICDHMASAVSSS